MATSEATTGHLGPGDFAGLVRDVVRRHATGRLEVKGAAGRRQLYFEAGAFRAAVSDAEDEKLGAWLVARGLLDAEQMAMALLRQPDGTRFGAYLVEEGLVEPERLAAALEDLAVCIVSRLLAPGGVYTLFEGERLPDDTATIDMTPASALVAAVRRTEDLAALESFLPGGLYPSGTSDAVLQYQGVQLSPQEAFLLSRIDGAVTVDQLRRMVPLQREQMTRCLAALSLAGLVDLLLEPASRPAAPEPVPVRPAVAQEQALVFTPEQRREFEEIARLAIECRIKDFFRRLGLTQGATQDQIHERYREYVRMFHPDRAREPHLRSLRRELAEIHDAIDEAYETISNPERRARYLEALKTRPVQRPEEQEQDQRRQRARRELARANVQRAQTLVRAGDFGAAVQLLDEAARAEPNADTLLLLARLEQRNPMWTNRVLDHLRLAIAMDPQFTEAWLELAAFWGKKHQKERQRQCLEKVLAYDPINSDALRMLAGLKNGK